MGRRKRMTKAEKGAASRERLLEVAIELFARDGYAATGLSALSRRARIAPTAIYWHFGSKEGLLAESLERAATLWAERIYKQAAEPLTPAERLDQFVAGIRDVIENHGDELALLLSASLQRQLFGPSVRAALDRTDARVRAYLMRGLAEGIGRSVPDLDLAAQTALAHVHEMLLWYRRHRDPDQLTRMLAHCRQMIVAAVIAAVQHADEARPESGERP